ncbi:MAG: metal-dependent transcriptional regulator [Chloroflexi bacterium]|nr:metal-dependent transcriptional regulator [Chloroflexota bacterium]MXX82786.1 metal-dependent transcriptional regulator [Chloroflexota bacterium]MYC56350.1 metal-dependent transcriptional regulator [Chloroflexota bacterium]MYD37576.1 metal-dependent transcriptional regulator [Chloroflexota bacterium]MYH65750.1 metal-dependent transcriptional regulator [Chloroflexota bacterium]
MAIARSSIPAASASRAIKIPMPLMPSLTWNGACLNIGASPMIFALSRSACANAACQSVWSRAWNSASSPLPAVNMAAELSSKMRAYLAEILRLLERQPQPASHVSSSQLAEALDISPPAVNRMVNRLRDLGLLRHKPYQGIAITEAGRVVALKHIRRQRIAEVFLVQVVGINWLDVHSEAQRLTDGLSEKVVARMEQMTGAPKICPHGELIPTADGTLPAQTDTPLAQLKQAARIRISRLMTREPDRLAYMEALGLLPGQGCEVIHVAPFDGPMQLKLGREFRIIGHSLARLIRVEVLP